MTTFERGSFTEALFLFDRIMHEVAVHSPDVVPHAVIGISDQPGELVLHFLGLPGRKVNQIVLDALYECLPMHIHVRVSRARCRRHADCLAERDLAEACWDREFG